MLLSYMDEKLQQQAIGPMNGQGQIVIVDGTDQRVNFYVAPLLEQIIGVTGPTPVKDGNSKMARHGFPKAGGRTSSYSKTSDRC